MSRIDQNTTLKQVLEDHQLWLRGEGGSRADLSEANLSRANLSEADLSGANLFRADLSWTNFDGDFPIIINTEIWSVIKCKNFIKIGCQTHSVDGWREFTDEQISRMDSKALVWWKKYKKFILTEVKDNE